MMGEEWPKARMFPNHLVDDGDEVVLGGLTFEVEELVTVKSEVSPVEVSFASDGLRIAGHLRCPPGVSGPAPALVLTGPFTGVKEQVTGT
jgi:hypothetical protein